MIQHFFIARMESIPGSLAEFANILIFSPGFLDPPS